MNTFLTLFRKYRKYIALVALAVLIFAYTIWSRSIKSNTSPNATPSPTPASEATGEWGSLGDLTKDLGEPLNGASNGPKEGIYYYNSNSVNDTNQVVYRNNNPVFFRQIVTPDEKKTSKSITQKYGDAEIILFGDFAELGYYLYGYPSKGLAYLGNKDSGTLFEVWYFSPIDKETFVTTWASEYKNAPDSTGF